MFRNNNTKADSIDATLRDRQQRLYAMTTAKEMDNNEAVLGALQQVRYVSALAKVDATVDIAKETLQNEPAGKSGIIGSNFESYAFPAPCSQ